MKFEEFLHKLDGVKGAGNERTAQCPAHEDGRNSLSVGYDNQKILVHCHAGCDTKNVVRAMGLTMADLRNGTGPKERKKETRPGEIVAIYNYTDEAGALLFQVTRHTPKDFRQRKPNGNGGWNWSIKGVCRVLYRLPEILASEGPVFIVEGEKDADRLASFSLCATTNSGGAAKWHLTDDTPLHDRDVIIVPDNDKAGRKHIDNVAASLHGKAASLRVLELPGLLDKGDVTDWLDLGHDVDELLALVDTALPYTPPAKEEAPGFATLAKELADVEAGEPAQLWAADHIEAAAQLSMGEVIKLKMQLKAKKAGAQFLDREWLPAVKATAKAASTGQPVADEGEPYIVERGRICKVTISKDEAGEESRKHVPLCNFDARIVADVIRDDGEEEARHVAIQGTLASGEPLQEITIPAGDLPRMEWPVASWGARVNVEAGRGTRDTLRHAIQWLSIAEGDLENRHIFTHTGWRIIDGQRVFLTANGALGADGVEVDLPQPLGDYVLPDDEATGVKEAMAASLALLRIAPLHITVPIWASMFLGPLTEILQPAFTLWIEGASGSYKSSLATLMLNHFGGKWHELNTPAGWESTANMLEKLCYHAKDIPLLIDDFRPSESKGEEKKMQDSAARVIRASGNRQGRGRLTAGSEFRRTFAPRGVVLATAEKNAMGFSVAARVMTVEVEEGDIDQPLLTAAQADRKMLPYAMAGFIRWMANDYDRQAEMLQSFAEKVRSTMPGAGHRRLPGAMAAMMAAFHQALKYAVESGAIGGVDSTKLYDEAKAALSAIAADQAELVAEQAPALIFMRTVVDLLASGQAGIDGELASSLGAPDRQRIGWHDGVTVHMLGTAHQAVYEHLSRSGSHFPSSARILGKDLYRAGYLVDSEIHRGNDDGRTQLQARDPGQTARIKEFGRSA